MFTYRVLKSVENIPLLVLIVMWLQAAYKKWSIVRGHLLSRMHSLLTEPVLHARRVLVYQDASHKGTTVHNVQTH